MKFKSIIVVAALSLTGSAVGEETNLVREVARHFSFGAFADVESAYWARGKIVDKNPFSAQYVSLEASLDEFGRIGGNVWSVSSMSRDGQSATRQNFYNEIDYVAYYGYEWKIVKDWSLDTFVGPKFVALPGYHPHAETVYEWNVGQSLKNPYVTPYYLMRRAYYKADWCYWNVGLMRSWEVYDRLTLTASAFGELGNSRHFRSQYGDNPTNPNGTYSNGLMSLNLLLRLDYALTDWFGLFAFVHQFDVVSHDAREAIDKDVSSPEATKDLTIFGVGLTLNF